MIKTFNKWNDVQSALDVEIKESSKKKEEITLYDGKQIKGNKNSENLIYSFTIHSNEQFNPASIIEIKLKDTTLDDAFLISLKAEKAKVSIPKSLSTPKYIQILVLVSDPSFILKELSSRIDEVKKYSSNNLLLNSIFGDEKLVNSSIQRSPVNEFPSTYDYNPKQYLAIKHSKTNNILFIWGPPGTGKTTVLGKIISDYVQMNETVLLCSNTNRALDVSILKTLEVSEHEDTPIKDKSLRWGNVYLTEEEDLKYVTLSSHHKRLEDYKRSLIKREVDLIDSYDELGRSFTKINLKLQPYNMRKKKHEELKKKKDSKGLNDHQKKIFNDLKLDIKKMRSENADDLENEKKAVQDKRLLVEHKIESEFDSVVNLRKFVYESTRVTFEEIIKDIKLQSATFSRTVLSKKLFNQKFDNIVIDEATMSNLPFIILVATLAKKRILFVGDPKQLSPIVLSKHDKVFEWMGKDIFLYFSQLNNVNDLFKWGKKNKSFNTYLSDQYRMPKKIFENVNDLFYEKTLINKTTTAGIIKILDTSALNPIITFPTKLTKSPVNVSHAQYIIQHILEYLSKFNDEDVDEAAKSIAILTPFTQQKRFIQYLATINYLPESLEVGVVHTFQGREKPIIYFDLTLSNIDFTFPTFDEYKTSITDVSRLLNVAISRCQSDPDNELEGELILIGNLDYFKKYYPNGIVNKFIQSMMEYSDELLSISDTNPFNIPKSRDSQIDVFEEELNNDPIEEIPKDEIKIVDNEPDKKIVLTIHKYCEKINKEIQLINSYENDTIMYTDTLDSVLAKLPITFCDNEDDFKLFIDDMYKLIYEATGGKHAKPPVRDVKAKFGNETYGKIRLVIHELRQFYFHDTDLWDKKRRKIVIGHCEEFFNNVIGKNHVTQPDEWVNCHLSVLYRTANYFEVVRKKLKSDKQVS